MAQLSYIFLFLLITHSLNAKPTYSIEGVNTSKYPQISISLRENHPHPLSTQNFVIVEEMEGLRTIPTDITIQRVPGVEPIQLVLSLQPTDSPAINQWSVEFTMSLSQSLSPEDRLHIHIQDESRLLLIRNQSYSSLKSGLVLPTQRTYSKTMETISQLLDNLAIVGNKPPFLLVVLHSKSIPDKNLIPEVTKKARRMGIPINVLGFPYPEAMKVAEYTDGKFYSLKNKESINSILQDILYYKKPPYKIQYTSRKKIGLLEDKKITIYLGILNVQNLTYEYRINFTTRLENTLRDPMVAIPVFLFLIIVGIAALVFLVTMKSKGIQNQKADASESEKGASPQSHDSLPYKEYAMSPEEERIYSQMYGKSIGATVTKSYPLGESLTGESDEYPPEGVVTSGSEKDQSLSGPVYSRAVLIQKEGPSPGRQYNIYGHETLIGRLETNHLVIYDNTLSPIHARIKNIQGHFVLYDMMSHSGVYLNGRKLLRPKVLKDFDEIQIGRTVLVFRGK